MSDGSPAMPNGADLRPDGGVPLRRKGGSFFTWSAPLSSPADVAGLEMQFPEIIQLPTAAIDQETEDWSSSGLIVRTLSRWVPSEAVIREFRRAGLAGRIDAISLAHRTTLLKFEFTASRCAALLQPWVVNGQPLAMEVWRPDFVPADDALSTALLWIRLPNLPLEYWNEDTLRSILSVAGQFVEADAFTKERRRGSYARASVRVDMSKPLRPGARIRAHGSPFWQQFAYEHVDCICAHCGSIHMNGACSLSSAPDSSAAAPKFGPWMAALRQRKIPPVMDSVRQAKSMENPGSATMAPLGEQDGWMKPGKTSRCTAVPSPSSPNVAFVQTEAMRSNGPCREFCTVPVTVASGKLKAVVPEASSGDSGNSENHPKIQKPTKGRKKSSLSLKLKEKHQSPVSDFQFKAESSVIKGIVSSSAKGCKQTESGKVTTNPFRLLGSDRWAGCSKDRGDTNPASLKRARPVEVIGPMLSPEASIEKDRASLHGKGLSVGVVPPLVQGPQSIDVHEAASIVLKAVVAVSPSVSQEDGPPSSEPSEVVPMESVQQPATHDPVQCQLSDQGPLLSSPDVGDHSDLVMMGAQSGA